MHALIVGVTLCASARALVVRRTVAVMVTGASTGWQWASVMAARASAFQAFMSDWWAWWLPCEPLRLAQRGPSTANRATVGRFTQRPQRCVRAGSADPAGSHGHASNRSGY